DTCGWRGARMPHMVMFRNGEGKVGYHPTESLEDAVRFVEHLRNNEQVNDARVFRMQEVPIEFKVLYKVEVSAEPAGGTGAAPAPVTSPPGATGGGAGGTSPAASVGTGTGPVIAPVTPTSAPATAATAPTASLGGAEAGPATSRLSADDSGNNGGRFGLFSRG
ncbi:MAG TPA: hypothetical protein VM030_00190, partial [Acidimicrobiales bacterium]|nr:hypothetical protein [Acidimicrobiales bacterium]